MKGSQAAVLAAFGSAWCGRCEAFTATIGGPTRRGVPTVVFPLGMAGGADLSPPSPEEADAERADGGGGGGTTTTTTKKKKRIVVVGGGWAGFSAADALASAGAEAEVTLLDASPRGRGGLAGGWRTPRGRPVEAGIHGFWREYKNTFRAVERIEGVELDDVLTPYTPSVLVSKSGRVALAPVLAETDEVDGGDGDGAAMAGGAFPGGGVRLPSSPRPEAILESVAPLLPPPLDVALLSEFSPESPLTIADRLSGAGLLGAWADFGQEDPESWDRYDSLSAEDLFKKYAGVSDGLYDELVSPLLHVLPMAPGYDTSAAAALSCFHVFALQTKGAFDVRWCRGGIAEKIFDPWATQLIDGGNVNIQGGARVTAIERAEGKSGEEKSSPAFEIELNGGEESIRCDAVVLAVGGTAMERIAAGSSAIGSLPAAQNFDKLRGVTCVAVRIFLKPSDVVTSGLGGGKHGSTQLPPAAAGAMKDSPVFVCGPGVGDIPELDETGFCVYDLQRLHDEFAVGASKEEKDGDDDVNNNFDGTAVLEVDFFRADGIADIDDDERVARLALRAASAALGANLSDEDVVDVAVVRARNAVSHFAPKSASHSPDVRIGDGIYMCGDWIDRSGHASWSTEKAVVTGRQAAGAAATELGLMCDADVIPAASDTEQLRALRKMAKILRRVAPPPDRIPPSPWKFAENLVSKLQE